MWSDTTRKQFARSWPAFAKRFDRRGMVSSGAFVELSTDRRGAAVFVARRAIVANAAARSVPADDDGAALLLPLARYRLVVVDQAHAAHGGTRGGGARGVAVR